MNLPIITKDDNCIYLTQDLTNMGVYDKAKAIVNFCDKETKILEKEIDRVVLDIFNRNGINIPNTDKSVLKQAFDMLNRNGKKIVVNDLYHEYGTYDYCELVKETKNHFTVVLEKGNTIQCGIEIKEIRL